jgi:hypothetical protein
MSDALTKARGALGRNNPDGTFRWSPLSKGQRR